MQTRRKQKAEKQTSGKAKAKSGGSRKQRSRQAEKQKQKADTAPRKKNTDAKKYPPVFITRIGRHELQPLEWLLCELSCARQMLEILGYKIEVNRLAQRQNTLGYNFAKFRSESVVNEKPLLKTDYPVTSRTLNEANIWTCNCLDHTCTSILC